MFPSSTPLLLHGKARGRAGPHKMSSLIGTSHLQLASFALGTIGWILCTISMGLVEWRVWHVDNTTIISSGIAWVGIWKVCFISYIHVSPGYEEQFCHKFSGYDSSIPGEIYAAQGLLVIAMVTGLLGLSATIFALRNIYMGISHRTPITRFFLVGGFFYVFAGLCVLIPVSYNFYSVTHNQSIAFPPSYYMPSSPVAQEAGAAIPIGIIAAILLLLSGSFSLSYRFPVTTNT
ncbi:claudin-34 isoform X1 [Numida meleagris]|uniref:claudin-34 isoform X1 n=2 Tax=Numida meleagris TaxID=8996 RepID=UPI000B3DC673|nr:claudin-34 isoform X1 [Numida meleagris]